MSGTAGAWIAERIAATPNSPRSSVHQMGSEISRQYFLFFAHRSIAARQFSPQRPPGVKYCSLALTSLVHAALLFALAVSTNAAVANATANVTNTSLRNVLLRP